MAPHLEEEPEPTVVPEPDEPDEPDEPEPAAAVPAGPVVPSVSASAERHYEYRVEVLTNSQVLDGTSLPKLLSDASEDEWQLVEIVDGGESKAVLLRKRKESKTERRRVGFVIGS